MTPETESAWLIGCIAAPLIGAAVAFLWPRRSGAVGLTAAMATTLSTLAVLAQAGGDPHPYPMGGWQAPLGIELVVDGLSVLMLAMTAVVGLAVSGYAGRYFAPEPTSARGFWPLWLFLWAALNALFLSADIFNLYVTLELLGLSAVALVALAGSPMALAGAMRYLLVSLLGSLLYLLGVALLYHAHGTLDLGLIAVQATPPSVLAVALGAMSAGLVLKTALFPFHIWLPPAHGHAPTPVSALLSALVIKASFYLLLRLWWTLSPTANTLAAVLGGLGAAAVLWGGLQALRQERLKLLVAYSTVAQVGYLFLAFPLAAGASGAAWGGVIYLMLAHALAKSAMFLAAGNILHASGHDRIQALDHTDQRQPLSLAAFGIAGVSLAGLPPSGGFIGKWLLLQTAIDQGLWVWAAVLLAGGLLTASYVFRVVGFAFTPAARQPRGRPTSTSPVPAVMQWLPLGLAGGAIILGFVAPPTLALLEGITP